MPKNPTSVVSSVGRAFSPPRGRYIIDGFKPNRVARMLQHPLANSPDTSGDFLCYNKNMEELDLLKKAGLSEAQAKLYNCLLQNGALTPTELAKEIGQSRENCYALAKRLVELGLIEQTKDKKSKIPGA